MGKVEGIEYVIIETRETRLANMAVKAAIDRMTAENAEFDSQIAHLTGCIQANEAKIAEFATALKALPALPVEKITEEIIR